jgi:phosphohistidine phosphatase
MDLYLIRHAQSDPGKSLGQNGINNNALNALEITELKWTGEALKALNLIPEAIVTSPLGHARHSAEMVASTIFATKSGIVKKSKKNKKFKSVQVWNDLAPEGDRALVYKNLAKFKYDSKILIVGHEPFLTKMAEDIVAPLSPSSNTRRRLGHPASNSTQGLWSGGRGNYRSIVLKKGGLARINITSMYPKLKGELCWLLPPMLLRRLSLNKKGNRQRKRKIK